jgi:hypothetical protein
MPRFYKHNREESLAESDARYEQAELRGPCNSVEWFAEQQLLHLQDIAERGLPDCYNGIGTSLDGPPGTPEEEEQDEGDCLYDFYADMPWNDKAVKVIELMLSDERFPAIRDRIKQDWDGFDIEEDLRKALALNRETYSGVGE